MEKPGSQKQAGAGTPIDTTGPLWSPKSIFWVGLLCSFPLAGIMQAINLGRLGQPETRLRITLFTIAGSLILFFLVPDRPPFNNSLILLAFNGVVSYGISRMHFYPFLQYRSAGGKAISVIKTLLFSVAGVFVLLLVIVGMEYLYGLLRRGTN